MDNARIIESIKAGDLAAIEALIAAGADLHQRDEHGWTPLNWAAGTGNTTMVRALVEAGADPFAVGRDQRTPYMIALAAGHIDVVRYLKAIEEKSGKAVAPEPRKYCKAYHLGVLRNFPGFTEERKNWKRPKDPVDGDNRNHELLSDNDVVFIHEDFTVTQAMWRGENIVFDSITPEWEQFCRAQLKFKVPDDIDLMMAAKMDGKNS